MGRMWTLNICPTCLFCKEPKSDLLSSCNMFSVKTQHIFEKCQNMKRGSIDTKNLRTFPVPMAWIVKAHVFQAMMGTRGHSSLGAVCSPTLWTVVAQTTSISSMLSENFLLKTNCVTGDKETLGGGGGGRVSLTVLVLRSSGWIWSPPGPLRTAPGPHQHCCPRCCNLHNREKIVHRLSHMSTSTHNGL